MMDHFLKTFIHQAIIEDTGDGDHSSLASIPKNTKGKARLIVKQKGVIAGIEVAGYVFKTIDPELSLDTKINDGSIVNPGDIAFTVEGKVHSVLQAERLVLNIIQRMSGVATKTRKFVDEIAGLQAKIIDTRKTIPGMRLLEKAAVKFGGGENHRMGLYDMIMLKDNHIDFAGGIKPAIEKTREYLDKNNKKLKIIIEARTLDDVKEIIQTGNIDRILLDNFSVEDTKEAVKLINGKFETESSGGINLQTVRKYAACGVDYISVGQITNQAKSLDMSLKALT
jgi:nicotinate-nucleotide pyrophosphorylase (carboxylating)